ncbi:hypothetical protein P7K49_001752 [Saguinus oedipus]|uniref:EF-hand domain-containing protein n=1 Tax=Saguinus oedipus TaxID=9490 RepID=A0ABQ9WGD1_SAGOE|nr:hypothetical protein P7K49_001752 [Saguinus oedipus]
MTPPTPLIRVVRGGSASEPRAGGAGLPEAAPPSSLPASRIPRLHFQSARRAFRAVPAGPPPPPASRAPASHPMVSSVLCRCVASPPPDAAAAASSSASSPASVGDPCGGAVCGGPDHRLRLWSLFQTLDVNRDGGLCVNDLAVGLRRLGLHRTEGELQVGCARPRHCGGGSPPSAGSQVRPGRW